ncbi:MAG: GAF domain-containing protein [Gammaproteobacteria bacterium]|nr:GAF domain-containing protein [Gammaproteobacteria bacterium]
MAESLDLVKSVFEHRLRQDDMDRILTALSVTDRDELITKMGELLRHISALLDVSNKVSDTLSLDLLLPRLIEIITDSLSADRSTLFLHDPETDELFSRVSQGDKIGEIRFPAHLGIAGSVFTSGEAVIIPDAYADPRFNQEIDRKTGYRTRNILCTPIKNKGRIIGASQVLNKHDRNFDQEDLNLLEALTSQAAAALENARLYEKVEKARVEEAKLLEITSVIASELQIDTLLTKVIHATTDMLEADRSTLFMYDAKTGELWSRIAEGLETREIRFPSTAGIAGACFTAGEIINIPQAYEDQRFNQEIDKKTGYRTRSILCMPVTNKQGYKLAVIQVLNKKGGPFGILDEKRLHAFTAQVAIALENAQLFEDVLNEKNYNESILKSLSNGVATLDAERHVIKANDAVLRILQWDKNQVLDRSVTVLFPGEANSWIIQSLAKVVATDEIDLSMDSEIVLTGGAKVSVNLTIVPLIDVKEEAIGYMLIMEDITSEKRVKSTMARYMTKAVADRLLESGEDALGGSAQIATVLFSDIRSFTTISEELGARKTVSMLNEYFTAMVDVVFTHNGILDKYIGDSIMALFGTPFPSAEDADNAILVANEMVTTLSKFNRQQISAGKQAIRIGIGVSTGELIAGNIGSPKRMDYTVIGDTVNLAARLESATKYYGVNVLFSEFTAKSLTGEPCFREIDLIRVKGKQQPVAVFEGLDHCTNGNSPHLAGMLRSFEQGLRYYRNREWKSAIRSFQGALDHHSNDSPSRLYLDRCTHYLDSPPPEDWGGVWTMMEK